MKNDARVRYTKKMITENFIQLLHRNPIHKITVKRICENSEINRSTFYKYYSDPFDLLQQIEDETFEYLQEQIEMLNNKDIESILSSVLSLILERQDFFQCIFFKQDAHSFHEKLLLLCYQFVPLEIFSGQRLSSRKEQEWLYYFLTQGSASILDYWVREDMVEQPQQIAAFIGRTNKGLLKYIKSQ